MGNLGFQNAPAFPITEYCSHEWGPFFLFPSQWDLRTPPSRPGNSFLLYSTNLLPTHFTHISSCQKFRNLVRKLLGILLSPVITLPYSQRFEVAIARKPTACTLKASRETSVMPGKSVSEFFVGKPEIFTFSTRKRKHVGGPPAARFVEICRNTLWEPLEHTVEAYWNTLQGPPEIHCGPPETRWGNLRKQLRSSLKTRWRVSESWRGLGTLFPVIVLRWWRETAKINSKGEN